jgi:hypothetical protein
LQNGLRRVLLKTSKIQSEDETSGHFPGTISTTKSAGSKSIQANQYSVRGWTNFLHCQAIFIEISDL